ncbi:uncharacterized protein L969DRAFT_93073 [Mixia osmundae IAM 14324]|uniref:Fumarylacetoacetase-like C-terminal domain-containing protein n=1 Tax=Mixia osmundae (strain CBS 9802 / IAM 14324 / JCM 22182 / KY 12970) TaxID=764103 RepID=G7E667_MIXOS|nr:uncharacterized protein L969DRAFT_93073 [Mixia osmundae IAM 14324]KEI40519.1 hypothetical protein L969DRAFT_93073 [Mixia osmundae IAM 14324]GAA98327.1 hypothetical protein E5Q_05012 [Mixia osmundae IAM 14324]
MASLAARFAKDGKTIIAIGRNYLEHIKELNHERPVEPFYFLKPTSSYLPSGGTIELPQGVDVHHEVELGVVIGKRARDVRAHSAMDYIAGYTLAIDLTARNMQEVVKKKGLPWSAVKGFDTFCPVTGFIPKQAIDNPHNLKLWLKINDVFKQNGTTADMMFKIPELIHHCSSIMTLQEGDLLLTGTPAGVSSVKHGDKITAGLRDSQGKELALWQGDARTREGGYVFSA